MVAVLGDTLDGTERDVPGEPEHPGERDDRRRPGDWDDHERRRGLPAVSIGDVTVVEGNGGTTDAVFPVTLSAATR